MSKGVGAQERIFVKIEFLPPPIAKRILISPLDWGMGHTTRCIPIIRYLESRGHTVILAGNEQQRAYWKVLIPDFLTLSLQGYDVQYSHGSSRTAVLRQLPKILRAVKDEHRWLLNAVSEHGIDGVISDNRYGLHHPAILSVIMTHQLRVISGVGGVADTILQKLHYRLLNRFDACWIPDESGKDNLGGNLSHPRHLPQHAKYIGLLSALAAPAKRDEQHILILLSGPEPQRSILSQKLWEDAVKCSEQIVFVEGSMNAPAREDIPQHIQWHTQLSGNGLQNALESASLVICRSGYSTLMDLALLRKRSILIPTPGQTEQEYLAAHLSEQKAALTFPQTNFSLTKALDMAQDFNFRIPRLFEAHNNYTTVLDTWLATL